MPYWSKATRPGSGRWSAESDKTRARPSLFVRLFRFGQQPAERTQVRGRTAGLRLREAAVPLRPMGANSIRGRFLLQGKPVAERTGLRCKGAVLRPGAAAGCWSLRDRTRRQTLRNKQRLRAADVSDVEFATSHLGTVGGCGLPVAARPIRLEGNFSTSGCCGPPVVAGPDSMSNAPQRTAAASCRSLRDRSGWRTLSPPPAAAARWSLRDRTRRQTLRNEQRLRLA